MNKVKTEKLSKQLIKALKCLIKIYNSKEDLYDDFPASVHHFENSIQLLKKNPNISETIINKLKNTLKFRRSYSVIELVDKIADLNTWFAASTIAAQNFCSNSNIGKNTTKKILKKYKQILLEGFLELVVRKSMGVTEVEAIKGFRYNMGGRLPEEYFVNLVRGWISEDVAKHWIKANTRGMGLKLISTAHDADRKIRFKSSRKGKGVVISGESDLIVKKVATKKEICLEIQRTDRGRMKETNDKGERPVNVPSHRPEIEKKAIAEHKKLILFLFNEGAKTNPPEIAVVVNPKKNKKLRRRGGDLFVWAKFYSVSAPGAVKALKKALS